MAMKQHVYTFGNGKAEGNTSMKALLGGKGANLAEMNLIGIPVPPGFTVSTEACTIYSEQGRDACFKCIEHEVKAGIAHVENIMGTRFGDSLNPLFFSVRSGARASMPGMMDTVLNLGMNDETVEAISKKTNDPRFAWDSYRRLIQMYGDVVLGLKAEKEEDDPFEHLLEELKQECNVEEDQDLKPKDLKKLVSRYKKLIQNKSGKSFPMDPWEQLWSAIFAVFESWNNDRAAFYRKLNHIPSSWGTAVNVQAMVYGNLGEHSGTGVAFTRNASTGENIFNGEYLINAQGEDVVAGIRTPHEVSLEGSKRWAKMTGTNEQERAEKYTSLEEWMPESYQKLIEYESRLEEHYKDMQDIEFTIQEEKLWILQTRNGKRTGAAMVNIAMDMLRQGIIDEETAIMRIDPERIEELLHPVFNEEDLQASDPIAQGLPASPGAATGQIVFFADDAETWANEQKQTILVRQETSPEDLRGMHLSSGILTTRGGMTSHAAIVARGMGKCCVSGAGMLHVDYTNRTLSVNGTTLKEGDWISLDGTSGKVFSGKIATNEAKINEDLEYLLNLADKHAKIKVRANADTGNDAITARRFGAKGIGLARTEHMFFEEDQIKVMREMILAETEDKRRSALNKMLPLQRKSFEDLFRAMDGFNVTIRLLDPPLHEFLPHEHENQTEMAESMHLSLQKIKDKVESLAEANPMLGHRGCRLGITYPEITEIQTRAIIEAALNIKLKEGKIVKPEIMVPLIGGFNEFQHQENIIRETVGKVFSAYGSTIPYHVGTMIEVPRAALTADQIATKAEFFSFGTNDLTQLTLGFSRDDVSKFLPIYLEKQIINQDPFSQIDEEGVGQLVEMAAKKGRKTNQDLTLGACGEHGGNPESIDFFYRAGLNYISCSPFRVPVARIAAAQATIKNKP
jgi:pyruvate,orthophosphate dikinase